VPIPIHKGGMMKHPPLKRLAGLCLLVIVLLASHYLGVARATSSQPLPMPPPESLEQAPISQPQRQTTKANTKLDAALFDLVNNTTSPQRSTATTDSVVVHIALNPADTTVVRQAVGAAGGEVSFASVDGNQLQAYVPVAALATLAEIPAIQMIRQPQAPQVERQRIASTINNEMLTALGVPNWHEAGFTGQGVTVGIIDNGFVGHEALLGTKLPPADRVRYRDFVDPRTDWRNDDYATAQAEVIHEIAPDAALVVARVSNELEFEQAAEWMRLQSVQVIVTYMGWYNLSPGDGTGFMHALISRSQAAGITWVTSAQHLRLGHWGGHAVDLDADGFLSIEGPRQINRFHEPIAAGQKIEVHMRWNDWNFVNQDVDLVIVRWNGWFWEEYAESDNFQNGGFGQIPTEGIRVYASGPTTYYGVALRSYRVDRLLNVDVYSPFLSFDAPTVARSILSPGDVPSSITVGAIQADVPFEPVSYSGQGPLNGPGGSRDGGQIKPDLVSFSGISTATYPNQNFTGTGPAVAQVAGMAALLVTADPSRSPAAIKQTMTRQAIDLQLVGQDTITGYGQAILGPAPDSYRPPFDFDKNRASEILWRNDILGATSVMQANIPGIAAVRSLPPIGNIGQQAAAVGDFDGNHKADVTWFDPFNNTLTIQLTDRDQAPRRWQLQAGWVVAGSADFNKDGIDDLLFRNQALGLNIVWLLRNGDLLQGYYLPYKAPRWQVVATGDFDGDQQADLIWRSRVTGRYQIWLLNGRQRPIETFLARYPNGTGWKLAGTGDLNGDHTSDLIWHDQATGDIWLTIMQNGQATAHTYSITTLNPATRIVAIGDYNSDRRADILLRDIAAGPVRILFYDGLNIIGLRDLPGACGCWHVVGAGTYDGIRLDVAGGPVRSGAPVTGPAPGDPDAPTGTVATTVKSTSPADSFTPDPGTPEQDGAPPIDTVVLPDAATIEQITQETLNSMLVGQHVVVLPLVVR
jgi:hypothetical protein